MPHTTDSHFRTIVAAWWPLAASWLFLALELPAIGMALSRLEQPVLSLAAFGGVVYPMALLIESPVFMFLGASTALSRDWRSFLALRRFMFLLCYSLTALFFLVAFTPLYQFLVSHLMGADQRLSELSRLGVMATIPWPLAVGYRRLLQGALIRFGHSRTVSRGTAIRLAASATVLLSGFLYSWCSSVVLAPLALTAGVLFEALYVHFRFKKLVAPALAEGTDPAPTLAETARYYFPLAATSVLSMVVMPIGTAAMLRLEQPMLSLAVWPVLSGLLFVLRTPGVALHEVVVSYVERPGFLPELRRFTLLLVFFSLVLVVGLAGTPLANLWFSTVTGLAPELAGIAREGLWLALPLPLIGVFVSWAQALLLHGRKTRRVWEATVLYVASLAVLLFGAVHGAAGTGLHVYLAASIAAAAAQAGWCWWHSREVLRELSTEAPAPPSMRKAA